MKTLVKTTANPLWNEFPGIFDAMMNDWSSGSSMQHNAPAVNVRDSDTAFHLQLAAPGYDKGDFNVELDNDLLTISSERKPEEKDNEPKFTRREFSTTGFKRSFRLPEHTVDGDKISARYENGILNVELPKIPEAQTKPRRSIEIG